MSSGYLPKDAKIVSDAIRYQVVVVVSSFPPNHKCQAERLPLVVWHLAAKNSCDATRHGFELDLMKVADQGPMMTHGC